MATVRNLMQLSKAQLDAAAEHWGVDGATKREIVDALQEREVTLRDYFKVFGEDDEDQRDAAEVFQDGSESVIVRMIRANPLYETHGFSFTRTHPFVVMRRAEAELLLKEEEGFRLSSQEETQDYYS
jgi:hypothetical protein